MQSVLDSYLGIHPQALALEAQRTEVLAANMANADTPNYKARDLDFKAALAAASGADSSTVTLATTHPNDLTSAGTAAGSAALDASSASSADAAPPARLVPTSNIVCQWHPPWTAIPSMSS